MCILYIMSLSVTGFCCCSSVSRGHLFKSAWKRFFAGIHASVLNIPAYQAKLNAHHRELKRCSVVRLL